MDRMCPRAHVFIQGLFFSMQPGLRYGLVQLEGGPCGVMASVQAFVLAALLGPSLEVRGLFFMVTKTAFLRSRLGHERKFESMIMCASYTLIQSVSPSPLWSPLLRHCPQQRIEPRLHLSPAEQQSVIATALSDMVWQARLGQAAYVASASACSYGGHGSSSTAALPYDTLMRCITVRQASSREELEVGMQRVSAIQTHTSHNQQAA
jgi:hypothetical protein